MSRIVELPEELIVMAASNLDSRDLTSLSKSLPELRWLRPGTISYTIPRRNFERPGVIYIMRSNGAMPCGALQWPQGPTW